MNTADSDSAVPVITIDGPAASGKGSVAAAVAATLRFHYLDSGKLYRAVALAGRDADISPDDTPAFVAIAAALAENATRLCELMKTPALFADDVAAGASSIAASAAVRHALAPLQRAARRPPGLVADGRDMGTVIFPDAVVKIYLIADIHERANRRVRQLVERGIHATIEAAQEDLQKRDRRDSNRQVAPLKPAPDSLTIDSTRATVDDLSQHIVTVFNERRCLSSHPPTSGHTSSLV